MSAFCIRSATYTTKRTVVFGALFHMIRHDLRKEEYSSKLSRVKDLLDSLISGFMVEFYNAIVIGVCRSSYRNLACTYALLSPKSFLCPDMFARICRQALSLA
jgi:hypothetical protein